ncbi:nitroreductase family deazaflavin-dependent oxidoreductase [Candidatus Bathyarchaeota archaeon]|nr:MAG: nitroreductase family deazaflavin-dependent oxidoreductase [Candidatus Bathyarchaeota archaeon]TMI30823.1 MAG: nitroreductase family deazaflavin-dependent oxidoreductase [Candidatus Bathyarchaeota archaeon]
MPQTDLGKALQTARELELTVTGRVSGKKVSLPVWFTYDSDELLLLPLKGTATNWYKNLVKIPALSLSLKGASISVKAKTSTDMSEVKKTIESFRAKYGAGDVKRYYSKFDACVKLRVP